MTKISRVERRKAETRERIYQIAISLFLEKGYDETTVDEIVSKADIAKGTFFNYFPAKEQILDHLGQQRIVMMEQLLTTELRDCQNAVEKINRLYLVLAKENEKEKEETELIVTQLIKVISRTKEEMISTINFRKMLQLIVEEGQRNGEFDPTVNPKYVAEMLTGIYFTVLFMWLYQDPTLSMSEEFMGRVALVLKGISIKAQ
ncbi:TetR/AcrR family transcriptional regulator [Brevibacillus sp. SYSU BS000544]|uniref:TetR/AcrR family transcriptional regulator n=1 Tax=Brevibacillus sp. SYSU BS000544 TaxID=3416443 RepID=UPI003CE5B306